MQNPPHISPGEHSGDEDDGDTANAPAARPSTPGETAAETASGPSSSRRSRRRQQPQQQQQPMLMRRWLQRLADSGDIPGLEWIDKDCRTRLRIPWCHGSRSEWNEEHSALFRAWAEHKGL